MGKLNLTDLAGGFASIATLNANSQKIETALENTLSRDGTTPNEMHAVLDMNSNRIINLHNPVGNTDAVPLSYLLTLLSTVSTFASAATLLYVTPGGVLTNVAANLSEKVTPQDFGAVGNGIANDTISMKAFFDYCIATLARGFIKRGTYLIDEGVLLFNCNTVDTPWPLIKTAGFKAVIFKGSGFADAPLIKITNGTSVSSAGRFWYGGCLGGISYTSVAPLGGASNRHALSLTGIWGAKFGYIYASNMQGSALYIPTATFGGNPDPNAVLTCDFEAVEAVFCDGRAITNMNGVGWVSNRIKLTRAVGTGQGALYAPGDGNHYTTFSTGECFGWAIYDPDNVGSHSNEFGDCEIDGMQYGIRLNASYMNVFNAVRFIHRYQYTPNTTPKYWPLVAIRIGDVVGSANIRNLTMNVFHRIEAGGTKADLGIFLDAATVGGNWTDSTIDQMYSDNAGFGITRKDPIFLGPGVNSNSEVYLQVTGTPVFDSRIKPISVAAASSATVVQTTGYNTAAAILAYPSVRYDSNGSYNNTTYGYTVPYTGLAEITVKFPIALTAGNRVTFGTVQNISGSYFEVSTSIGYHNTTGQIQTYQDTIIAFVSRGTILYPQAIQNSGAPVNMSFYVAAGAESMFSVKML